MWEATARALVANVATPEAFNVPVPSDVTPSKNSALPAGVPVPGEFTVTVAVNVIDCPNFDGFAEDVTAVVVPPFSTFCVNTVELLPL